MQGIQLFLVPLPTRASPSSRDISVKVSFGSRSYSAVVNDKIEITIKDEKEGKSYTIRPQCMLFPNYSGSIVKSVNLCEGYSNLSIEGKQQEISNLYQLLCRVMSHKGFTDFYKPIKRLGRGNFATVYLVEHKHTGIRRAAKVFSKVGQGIEFKGLEALQTEIKTLREIDHPNLVRYDGLYETQSLVYLVTEYLSGGTLDDTLKCKGVHTGQLIQSVIRDLLSGLAYLDEKKIMHRDIKPQNVILREEDGKWVIGDFGLAAHSDQNYIYDKCGTMGYMAPEIWELSENEKYAQACDTYSLGVIAYQLIIGQLPFRVESENFFDKKLVWVLFEREECKKIHPEVLAFLKSLLDSSPQTRITPKQALKSPFFTNKEVVNELFSYHEKRRQDRYDRILKMANQN